MITGESNSLVLWRNAESVCAAFLGMASRELSDCCHCGKHFMTKKLRFSELSSGFKSLLLHNPHRQFWRLSKNRRKRRVRHRPAGGVAGSEFLRRELSGDTPGATSIMTRSRSDGIGLGAWLQFVLTYE